MNLTDEPFYTIQGEGYGIGRPSIFVRFSGCNLRCKWIRDGVETICDTPYSSFKPERFVTTLDAVSNFITTQSKAKQIIVTGGEPLMWPDQVWALFNRLPTEFEMTIETNGTLLKDFSLDSSRLTFSISPKITTTESTRESRSALAASIKKSFQSLPSTRHILKFVLNDMMIHSTADMIHEFIQQTGIPERNVYLMPEGVTSEQIDEKQTKIAEMAMMHGWNYTDRMHLRLWKGRRNT